MLAFSLIVISILPIKGQQKRKMENTALLIIDIQNDYFPGGKMELKGAEQAGRNAKQILGFLEKTIFLLFILCMFQPMKEPLSSFPKPLGQKSIFLFRHREMRKLLQNIFRTASGKPTCCNIFIQKTFKSW